MSVNGHLVIDADSHIREYGDVDRTYRDYIDPEYRASFEQLSRAVAKRREAGRPTELFMHPEAIIEPSDESRPLGVYGTFGLERDARPPSVTVPPVRFLRDPLGPANSAGRHRSGHDRHQRNVPQLRSQLSLLRDLGFENGLHRACHRFMSNYCSEAEGRLRWVANASMRDIPGTIQELTYWAEQDTNLVGVLVPPSCPEGRLLDNPDLHPLFRRAQELDLPILVHGGVLRSPNSAGATELTNSGFIIRAVYQPWARMTAVSALIAEGVFDLFTELRVGVFETTGGWMPWLIEQLDESYHARPT